MPIRGEFIDVLNVDIEGSEKELFEDSPPWLAKVGVIVAELHDGLRPGCSRSFYVATQDFDVEFRIGENVFVAKKGRIREPLAAGLPACA